MSKEEIKNLVERAAWTFAQTFLASFVVVIPAVLDALQLHNFSAARAIIVSAVGGAVAAGLSAVKTVFVSQRGK